MSDDKPAEWTEERIAGLRQGCDDENCHGSSYDLALALDEIERLCGEVRHLAKTRAESNATLRRMIEPLYAFSRGDLRDEVEALNLTMRAVCEDDEERGDVLDALSVIDEESA